MTSADLVDLIVNFLHRDAVWKQIVTGSHRYERVFSGLEQLRVDCVSEMI